MDTLVLNRNYMPVNQVNWQTAITWVVSGRAEVLDGAEYDDWYIRSPSKVWKCPQIIRLVSGAFTFKQNRKARFNRKNVWLRDKGRCQDCGNKADLREFTLDHVIPRSQGGKTCWKNVVVACLGCNQRKRDRTPQQARMRLLTQPTHPMGLPTGFVPLWAEGMPVCWKDYLRSKDYWNGTLDE